jgi:succinoglycan biosynthesis transport protein ExoP
VSHDNSACNGDGSWQLAASRNGNGHSPELARLAAREAGHGPETPGSWSRFLAAHVRWILAVTLAVVAVATAFALTRTPLYRSVADVIVQPAPVAAAGGGEPDMGTEAGIATSGIVLSMASHATGVPAAALSEGLSAKEVGTSYVLQIIYSSPDAHVAQQRAQAIAQAYTSFRSPHSGSKSATSSTAPVATLITPASLPASPYSPSYPLDIGVALLVGLALALATAWGRDRQDDRLRGLLDLERQADAEVLALIPAFRPHGPEPGDRLAMALSPRSIVAEAYRDLRTRVLVAVPARHSWTLLVSSPAWEDRGTVAANLAAALALSGRGTLLVCADMRWGCAHLVVGTGDGPGLSGLLAGRTDLAGALQPTKVPGLALLPPGALPADPAALLQQPALFSVLKEIHEQADLVVIEAPPLLASPDSWLLASTADLILLVADARVSTRAQVRAAALQLTRMRAKRAGYVVVNVGRRRRLQPGRPDLTPRDHAPGGWSGHTALSNGSQASTARTTLLQPGSETTKDER